MAEPGPSKSQVKREMLALQKLAERLTKEAPSVLARMPLSEGLVAALAEARRIKSMNALRRHYRRLAKLLCHEEVAAIRGIIDENDRGHQDEVARFHAMERWRERLLEGGSEAFGAFLDDYPHADRQHLRQLIQAAQRERGQEQPPLAYRKLFKYLRGLAGL
jgi:ribosome-associated protein